MGKRVLMPLGIFAAVIGMLLFMIHLGAGTNTSAAALATRTAQPPTSVPGSATTSSGTISPPSVTLPTGVPTAPSGPLATPNPNGVPLVGVPAISPTIRTTDASLPAFSVQDATAFVLAHPNPGYTETGTTAVTSVQFLAHRDVAAQNLTNLGVAPDRLICVVQMTGAFSVMGIPGSTPHIAHHVYQFFDAKTGNLLRIRVPD